MSYCTQCGTKLPDNSKFCHECGKPVSEPCEKKKSNEGAKTMIVFLIAGAVAFFIAGPAYACGVVLVGLIIGACQM